MLLYYSRALQSTELYMRFIALMNECCYSYKLSLTGRTALKSSVPSSPIFNVLTPDKSGGHCQGKPTPIYLCNFLIIKYPLSDFVLSSTIYLP